MSLRYIRNHYDVPAFRGQRVVAYDKPGVITGSCGQYLRIRLAGASRSKVYHPTHGTNYQKKAAK